MLKKYKNERMWGYIIFVLIGIVMSFILGSDAMTRLQLCIPSICVIIAGILIVKSKTILNSEIFDFIFFLFAMILGGVLYDIFDLDAHSFCKVLLWASPLLWLIFDIFSYKGKNEL